MTTPPKWMTRGAIAGVWFYEGLWCKLLGRMPHQNDIVHSMPFFSPKLARLVLPALGAVEVGLGLWVLSGKRPVLAAAAQTALLAAMNTNGILFGRKHIHDPAGMVIKNLAFVTLIWVEAGRS